MRRGVSSPSDDMSSGSAVLPYRGFAPCHTASSAACDRCFACCGAGTTSTFTGSEPKAKKTITLWKLLVIIILVGIALGWFLSGYIARP